MTFSFRRKNNPTRNGGITLPIVENGQLAGCILFKSDEELPEMTEEEFKKLMGEPPANAGS